MSYEQTPDGGIAETMDEHHSQPRFVGILGLALAAFAILFGLVTLIAAMSHPGVY
jgi:hypothetical protein